MASRILIYNIAYATGFPSGYVDNIVNFSRYLKVSTGHLGRISEFIDSAEADIVGLLEVDTGSFRTKCLNQAEVISRNSKHYTFSSTKYGDSITGRILPILRKQGNAILTRSSISNGIYHFFPGGFKKLIIELQTESYRFFLLHLSLSKRVRRIQLKHMTNLLKSRRYPVIIGGDFNTFSGINEINEFKEALNLVNPNNKHISTYPAWKPRHQLDFILCSQEIKPIDFKVPDVRLSDHLPLIFDFEVG